MEYLNLHRLRYFWTVARKGGVRKAANELRVSQPSISAQLKLLEDSLGEKLFRHSGRNLVLTETGQLTLTYADEIFSAGRELMHAIKQRPGGRALRLDVGMTDSLSKLIAFEILKPAFHFSHPTLVICRQVEIGPLGAVPAIATKLRRNFPRSLHGAPALLPSENIGMRMALESWFDVQGVRPRLVGEFEDSTLMEVASSGALGFTTVHTVVDHAALKHYGLKVIAKVEECGSDFYAITV